MHNVMFITVDEGYPNTEIVSINDEQMTKLKSKGYEINCEDDDFDEWLVLLEDCPTIEMPATVDNIAVIYVY
jgi:hypothetical protein